MLAPVEESQLARIPDLSVGIMAATQDLDSQVLRSLAIAQGASIPTPPPAGAALLTRLARLRDTHRLVAVDLPGGTLGQRDLRALSARRAPGELLLVVQRAARSGGEPELLWAGAAGLAGGGLGELSSETTTQRGLIGAIDLAPTILGHLDLPVPAGMDGRPIHTDGPLDSAYLRGLMARLGVISARRLPALGWLLAAWALLVLGSARWPRARTWALRAGALGVLWAPVIALVPAAMEPSAAVEYATIALGCLALGALTDRLLPWPRALLAPAILAVLALTADALAGTQLSIRSLLGPDPALGVRFYGIGNDLKSGLAVLVFAAVAAALYPVDRSSADRSSTDRGFTDRGFTDPGFTDPGFAGGRRRRAAWTMAVAGAALAAIEGAARIGAGVGGVILVCAGGSVATVILLPGEITRRRALTALIVPAIGLVALAGIDLATAHGTGQYTGSVLHAHSLGELGRLIARRYASAWNELGNGAMPVVAAVAVLCAGLGVYGLSGPHRRRRLLAPVGGDPAWLAALAGGLTAGVVGALVEDSGPVLLVVAVFALACVLAYLWASGTAVP